MTQPNIFHYATSELSQDAFITWLVAWSDKKYKTVNANLYNVAVRFVQELLGVDSNYKIEEIEVGRQWKNIDVWALVNNKYFIIIEDKTGTSEHSNQLNRYVELAQERFQNTEVELKLVYFKMEEQGDYRNVEEAGFNVFGRDKMLSVLESYFRRTPVANQNDIISDFYKNLLELDTKIISYKTQALENWTNLAWQGLFAELQKHISGNWGYVANASGGFMGYWFNFQKSEFKGHDYESYLLLMDNRFVIKLVTENASIRQELREWFSAKLLEKASHQNISISKFGRLGKNMGVAEFDNGYLVFDNGKLNLELTLQNIKLGIKRKPSVNYIFNSGKFFLVGINS